jgi:hypothetical protein
MNDGQVYHDPEAFLQRHCIVSASVRIYLACSSLRQRDFDSDGSRISLLPWLRTLECTATVRTDGFVRDLSPAIFENMRPPSGPLLFYYVCSKK